MIELPGFLKYGQIVGDKRLGFRLVRVFARRNPNQFRNAEPVQIFF